MLKKFCILLLSVTVTTAIVAQNTKYSFRIRTITAGVTLQNLQDTATLISAIEFLKKANKAYSDKGYEVQTLRVSTQNLYKYLNQYSYEEALPFLERMDKIARQNNISYLSIGQILPADKYDGGIASWVEKLVTRTSFITFSLPISSHEKGIHYNSIKAAAETILALSKINGGEANFRFTASANCPANIPFVPAAFHEGENSFGIGLEFPKLLTQCFKSADPTNVRQRLKSVLEENFIPVQEIAEDISRKLNWQYDGIDASTAPGLEASIGEAIETYTGQPFGSASTLSACAMLTDVLKSLNIKKCGYSGLMLPVVEDRILAQRATEGRYSVQELLLYSAVSGTGLDVVPLPGDISEDVLRNLLADVAALSLKYTSKALSARLFLIPGKKAGDTVKFESPYLTSCVAMKLE